MVEHQDRHHAVVLTEFFPDALLDRSPGIVIELNVCQELGGAGVTVLGSVGSRGERTTTSSTLCQRFRFGLRGYVDNTLPSRSYASPWSCVCVGIFFEILRSQQWHQSQVLCVDVICTSRTQVSCGRYKSYCLPACHTLVRRYCWMKRPGPTLRVRLRETGSTAVFCTQVASGCQFLQL